MQEALHFGSSTEEGREMDQDSQRTRELVDLFSEALSRAGFESETRQGDEGGWLVWTWTRERGPLVQRFEFLVRKPDLHRALANVWVFLKHQDTEVLVDGRTLSELATASGEIEMRRSSLFWWFARKKIVKGLDEALAWFELFATIPLCIERIESGESNLGTENAAGRIVQLLRQSSADKI
jgi:hypothetical protein